MGIGMTIDKILILGVDALEHDLVEKWNLKNLKQKEYGKTHLPLTKEDGYFYTEPSTTIMWPSFITGLPPKKHGIDTIKIYPFQPLYKLYLKISTPSTEDHLTPIATQKTLKRKILDRISKTLPGREPCRNDIKTSTIFDIPDSIHLHIPVYDNNAYPKYKKRIVDAIENKAYTPIFEMMCKREFNQRTKEVFEWLEKTWTLFMQYFFTLDGVQHAFYNNPKKIAKFYLMFDQFVKKLRKKINNKTLLLIISDHGQKRGIHTPYGFYSTNIPLGLEKPKLTDFRWKIEEILKHG